MYLVISLLVLREGCGIWLYQFLIIAYHFTSNTHVELFPKFGPQNKFFDNHEYSRHSLKMLLFLDSGVWRNLWSASFLSGRWQQRGINVTGSLNRWPRIFWPLLCRIRINGVYGQPLLQWSTTESQGLIQKFPCTICTSRSIQRKDIYFDFGKINML